jgi:tRNA(His) 5'-end guanylyltransferase
VKLLAEHGIRFATTPAWQRRGAGAVWETFHIPATDRKTGQPTQAERRRIAWIEDLPRGADYASLIHQLAL